MAVRKLGPGDEATAEAACRLFELDRELDTGSFLGRPEASLFVVEEGSTVAGCVYGHELIHPDGERTMLLYALDVAEHARRRGHGKALVAAFVGDARARGCTEVWVLTDDGNAAALATYASAGGLRDPGAQVMFSWKLAGGNHS